MQQPNSAVRDWSAVAFASFFPLFMAYIYFIVLNSPESLDNPAVMIAYGAAKIVQGLFPAVFVCWFERERLLATQQVPAKPGLLSDLAEGLVLWVGFQL